jgi:hypothetical protein
MKEADNIMPDLKILQQETVSSTTWLPYLHDHKPLG